MTIRNLHDLSRRFSESMAWRRTELSAIKLMVSSPHYGEEEKATLVRAAVALLYAHWEGFVKDAATAYLEFVARRGLRYNDLTSNFVALAMKTKLREARDTQVAEKFIEVVDFFRTGQGETFRVNWDDAISTESNLKAKVFKGIIDKLGLDYTPYATKENLIDEKLLEKRNKIAHGKYLFIDFQEYVELHDEVIFLIDRFQEEIIDAARNGKYLHLPSS